MSPDSGGCYSSDNIEVNPSDQGGCYDTINPDPSSLSYTIVIVSLTTTDVGHRFLRIIFLAEFYL